MEPPLVLDDVETLKPRLGCTRVIHEATGVAKHGHVMARLN